MGQCFVVSRTSKGELLDLEWSFGFVFGFMLGSFPLSSGTMPTIFSFLVVYGGAYMD